MILTFIDVYIAIGAMISAVLHHGQQKHLRCCPMAHLTEGELVIVALFWVIVVFAYLLAVLIYILMGE